MYGLPAGSSALDHAHFMDDEPLAHDTVNVAPCVLHAPAFDNCLSKLWLEWGAIKSGA